MIAYKDKESQLKLSFKLEDDLREKQTEIQDIQNRLSLVEQELAKRDILILELNVKVGRMTETWEAERNNLISNYAKLVNEKIDQINLQTIDLAGLKEMNEALMKTIEISSIRENEVSQKFESLIVKVKCYEKILSNGQK
jgi:hypothetical protein